MLAPKPLWAQYIDAVLSQLAYMLIFLPTGPLIAAWIIILLVVVLINGARQAGKSTLVRAVAGDRAAEWRDLDLPQDRQSALADPVGFVSFGHLLVIDEIQRAPELLLAIKATVDADPRARPIPVDRVIAATRATRTP